MAPRDNIVNIVKYEYFIPELDRFIVSKMHEVTTWQKRLAEDPAYAFEIAEKAVNASAAHRVMSILRGCLAREHDNTGTSEWSNQEIKDIIWQDHQYRRALPTSSSAMHNLVEQSMLEFAMNNCFRSGYELSSILTDAKFNDPEYKEYYAIQTDQRKAEQEAKRIADEQKKRDERKARRAARKDQNNGNA